MDASEPAQLPPALREMLASSSPTIRLEAVVELGRMLTVERPPLRLAARHTLQQLLWDDSDRVKEAALRALDHDDARQGDVASAPVGAPAAMTRPPGPSFDSAGWDDDRRDMERPPAGPWERWKRRLHRRRR